MDRQQLIKVMQLVLSVLKGLLLTVVLLIGVLGLLLAPGLLGSRHVSSGEVNQTSKEEPEVVDNIHVATGLVAAEGLKAVIQNCTGCHSSKLIIQNRMSRESWATTINWMQQTQGLWDLGENTQPILDYLATNYAPSKKGRRENLTAVDWYELD